MASISVYKRFQLLSNERRASLKHQGQLKSSPIDFAMVTYKRYSIWEQLVRKKRILSPTNQRTAAFIGQNSEATKNVTVEFAMVDYY